MDPAWRNHQMGDHGGGSIQAGEHELKQVVESLHPRILPLAPEARPALMDLLSAVPEPLSDWPPDLCVARGAKKEEQPGGRIQGQDSHLMDRRLHLALGVADIEASIADYSSRLGLEPDCIVPGIYALWRTAALNVSIRVVPVGEAGQLRHLGWEEPDATAMETSVDVNGILWERFSCSVQRQEIEALWGTAARFQ